MLTTGRVSDSSSYFNLFVLFAFRDSRLDRLKAYQTDVSNEQGDAWK